MEQIPTIQSEACGFISERVTSWEDATCFVTDKVAFRMRNLIKTLRKNYWGIFDEPFDKVTKRKKIWYPLTESTVETVVKNIDLDTKDMNMRARNSASVGLASIVRAIVKHDLDNDGFGEDIDMLERQLAIDGTVVWKTVEVYDEDEGGIVCKRVPVDLLNFYIDPTAKSIQETPIVIERALMTRAEMKLMDGWVNTDEAAESDTIHPIDKDQTNVDTNYKYVEVYEAWGMIPEKFITGNSKDTKLVRGQLVVSGTQGKWKFHYAALNTNKKKYKPYEEAWYTRIPGRWYGKGIAEKLMWLQLWVNIIINIRINRATISQLGIFKIKKGSGITPQILSKLAPNGAIPVNSMDDIEQFVMDEASESSYKDEANINDIAMKVTSAFEAATGEKMPSSQSATGVAIQNTSSQSQFTLIKEGIGMFLGRWMNRQYMPRRLAYIKKGEIYRITGEVDDIRKWDEAIANKIVHEKLSVLTEEVKRLSAEGQDIGHLIVPDDFVEREKQAVYEKLAQMGDDRYTKLKENLRFEDYEVKFYVTNEEIDQNVMINNLMTALGVAPEYKDIILRQVFDIMGLDSNQLERAKQAMMVSQQQQAIEQQGMMQAGVEPGAQPMQQKATSMLTEAKTLNNPPRV